MVITAAPKTVGPTIYGTITNNFLFRGRTRILHSRTGLESHFDSNHDPGRKSLQRALLRDIDVSYVFSGFGIKRHCSSFNPQAQDCNSENIALAMSTTSTNDAKLSQGTDRLRRFYRGTLFQIILIGLISFTQPGIWTALSNLGAGGLAEPFYANAATLITYLIMFFFAPVFSVAISRLNVKWVLAFGTLGFAPWSASLYCNSVYGTQWFMILGAITCGFSASALWIAESAIAVGYPEQNRRGLYISIWLALNKLGSVIGTSVQLALNITNDQKGSISPKTYLVLIGLQCLGLPLSLLVSSPERLIRPDGTKAVVHTKKTPILQGFREFCKICKIKRVYLLVPIFFTWQWGQAQQGMYLIAYFTVAGRVVAGFVVALISIVADLVYGWFLDSKIIGRRSTRARAALITLCAVYTASYVYNFVTEKEFQGTGVVFDYTSPGYARAVAVYCLWRIPNEGITVWLYWVLGTFDEDVNTLAHTTALLRAFESLGQAIPYGIGSNSHVSLMTHLVLAAVTFWLSVPPTFWSAWLVTDDSGDY